MEEVTGSVEEAPVPQTEGREARGTVEEVKRWVEEAQVRALAGNHRHLQTMADVKLLRLHAK